MAAIKIFSGNSNLPLAKAIAEYLHLPLGEAVVSRFSDGEVRVQLKENVRGADVYIIQSTGSPAENIMELLLLIDAARRASAKRITAVIPYFGYGRQDKKDEPRVPISAKVIANLLTTVGVNRVVSVDLHVEQIQGFFDIPVDHLYAAPVFVEHIKNSDLVDLDNLVVVSPDAGHAKRARGVAKRLENRPLAIVDKRRSAPNVAAAMNVIGDVKGKVALLLDDIVDTAGSLVSAANALKDHGAVKVFACCTHLLLSGEAINRISNSPIEKLWGTDSLLLAEEKRISKIDQLSIAPLLGEAISRIHNEQSISSLFI